MTTNAVQIELDPRELTGKKVGRLRRVGSVPVHLYGPGMEPRALQCQASRLIQVLATAGGAPPIQITLQGESVNHLACARERTSICATAPRGGSRETPWANSNATAGSSAA